MAAATVWTTLNYCITPDKGGDTAIYPGTAGNLRRKHDTHQATITDIRNLNETFCLDVNGFELVKHSSIEKDFINQSKVKEVVYHEASELLKKVTGATRVHPFSHVIRVQAWDACIDEAKDLEDRTKVSNNPSARYVHVDQSYLGAVEILKDNMSEEDFETLCKTRWGIINVWRPIRQPVRREPLAICDARSVPDSDLCPVRAYLPTTRSEAGSGDYGDATPSNTFELALVKANPAHKWYYASGMTPDEVLLIKIFDSKTDGRARRVPHSAFATEDDEGPPRQSIEMRCLVFWEDQSLE